MLNWPSLLATEEKTKTEVFEAAYAIFWQDFVFDPDIIVEGNPVRLKHGLRQGKELTFWHLASNSANEKNGEISRERCSFVPWLKFMLENYEECLRWENQRGKEKSLCLVDSEWRFLIVLRKRTGYFLLWTAYPLSKGRKIKLQKEATAYWQSKAENASKS